MVASVHRRGARASRAQPRCWSIRRFVRTARRYRAIQIQTGAHIIPAAGPLPDDLRHALTTTQVRTNLPQVGTITTTAFAPSSRTGGATTEGLAFGLVGQDALNHP
jgi:hypothetical protein